MTANSKNKPGAGRPKLADDDKRNQLVSARMNAAEIERIDALRGDKSRAVYMREAALNQLPPVIPDINIEAWSELRPALGNLNQIARHLNEGRAQGISPEALAELTAEIKKLRDDLRGKA